MTQNKNSYLRFVKQAGRSSRRGSCRPALGALIALCALAAGVALAITNHFVTWRDGISSPIVYRASLSRDQIPASGFMQTPVALLQTRRRANPQNPQSNSRSGRRAQLPRGPGRTPAVGRADPQPSAPGYSSAASNFPEGQFEFTAGETFASIRIPGRKIIQPSLSEPDLISFFSPDGKQLATSIEGRATYLWDLQGGRQRAILPSAEPPVAFSWDGRYLATGSATKSAVADSVVLWDTSTGEQYLKLQDVGGQPLKFQFSNDGRSLMVLERHRAKDTADVTRSVGVWDTQSGERRYTANAENGSLSDVALSPDGMKLAGIQENGLLIIWNAEDGTEEQKLRRLATGGQLIFAEDSKMIFTLTGSLDRWRVQPKLQHLGAVPVSLLPSRAGGRVAPRDLALWPDENTLAILEMTTSPRRDDLQLFRITTDGLEKLRGFRLPRCESLCQLSPTSQTIVELAERDRLVLRDLTGRLDSMSPRATLQHNATVRGVAFSADNEFVVTVGGDLLDLSGNSEFGNIAGFAKGGIAVWDAKSNGHHGVPLKAHAQEQIIHTVRFFPDGKRFIAAGYGVASKGENSLLTGSVPSGKLTMENGHGIVRSLALSPDGELLALSNRDNAKLIRLDKGTDVLVMPRSESLDFSADGKFMATSSAVVDIERAQAPIPILARGNVAIRFVPGTRILACALEHQLTFWDFDTGESVGEIRPQELEISCVAISPDGKTVALGGARQRKGIVTLWDITTLRPLAAMESETPGVRSEGGNDPRTSTVRCVAFSPDRKTLASGGDDHLVRLWDVSGIVGDTSLSTVKATE